jgi:hypothetical protein
LEPSGGNVNVLNPGGKTDMGESSQVHGVEVLVMPVAEGGAEGRGAGRGETP